MILTSKLGRFRLTEISPKLQTFLLLQHYGWPHISLHYVIWNALFWRFSVYCHVLCPPRPRGFSVFKMATRRNPQQGCWDTPRILDGLILSGDRIERELQNAACFRIFRVFTRRHFERKALGRGWFYPRYEKTNNKHKNKTNYLQWRITYKIWVGFKLVVDNQIMFWNSTIII